MTNIPDFVIIGQEDWDEIWRRNQFIIAELARRAPDSRFLFVEMPFDLTYSLRSRQLLHADSPARRKWRALRAGVRPVEGFANIHTLVAPKLLPDGVGRGERLNAAIAARVIRRAMHHLGINRPILWTQNPFAAALLGTLGESRVIYDVTDDWTALTGASARFVTRVAAGDAALVARADCVITCSSALYTMKAPHNPRTVLIPNGVDVAHYAAIGTPDAPLADAMRAIPHPIAGYTGSLHEARLDIDLICAVAAARPDLTLVFVGPNFLTAPTQARLATYPNIRLLGPVAYRDIPAYMQGFDVLMIPHTVSDFTESLNPIKMFEYLAAGLPIVSADVAGVRDYHDIVRIIHTPQAFSEAVDAAIIHRGANTRVQARQYAAQARWADRVDQVLAACEPTTTTATSLSRL